MSSYLLVRKKEADNRAPPAMASVLRKVPVGIKADFEKAERIVARLRPVDRVTALQDLR